MKDIPELAQLTNDATIVEEGNRFLAELDKDSRVKSLAAHTCETVNTEQHSAFKVRISQTRKGGKVVVSFTYGAHAVCFMVKTSHKFTYKAEQMIAAVKDAAAHSKHEVIDMCKHRPAPMEPVRYGANARHRAHRAHFNLRPEFSRKPQFRSVAAQ
jgi:hypothetical protein